MADGLDCALSTKNGVEFGVGNFVQKVGGRHIMLPQNEFDCGLVPVFPGTFASVFPLSNRGNDI